MLKLQVILNANNMDIFSKKYFLHPAENITKHSCISVENVQSCVMFSNSKTTIFYEQSNPDFSIFFLHFRGKDINVLKNQFNTNFSMSFIFNNLYWVSQMFFKCVL